MTIRVYQYAIRPPVENESLVRAQLRAAHDYRNDLVQIERGRRWALRALEDTDAVHDAVAQLKAATKTTRKAALKLTRQARDVARREARCAGGYWAVPEGEADRYPYSPLYETERIALLDAAMRRGARALTTAFWGTYWTIEQSHEQVRRTPLYDDDGLTPCDPRFARWRGDGQVGMQLQGGLATPDGLAGHDTRVRLTDGLLWLRVGSQGRAPVWAKWPADWRQERGFRSDVRQLPDAGRWKWVRVSCRLEGPRERWSVEITVDDPAPLPRTLDTSLSGVLAVEVAWDKPGDEIHAAYWRDDSGRSGTITLSAYDQEGIRKSDGIRSVRDTMLADMAKRLRRAYAECRGDQGPAWLAEAIDASQYWKSQTRAYALVQRWRRERCDAARPAYDLLQEWELRDHHLWEYESGARGQALRRRREQYRVQAVTWARQYRHVILDDRVLSREARWGDASDLRFTAAPSEFRECIRQAFGGHSSDDVSVYPVREEVSEEDDRSWCERAIDAKMAGVARNGKKPKRIVHAEGGAWSTRKAKRGQRAAEDGTAREAASKIAE